MRSSYKWIVAAAIFVAGAHQNAGAGFIGMPSMLGPMVKRISFDNFTLAPMAFTQFCLRYADQCKPPQIVFRGGPVRLTEDRWADLREVNKAINASIVPEPNTEGLACEKWLINPASGDCNDYAVSKRFKCSNAVGRLARCF
jgi:predicted transglutaminase-like cysteine proteinase